ncbi:MAG: type II toxin-antitoxin system RelE/ParE family toxin [Alphaproteobacteria bacterium]|nr:type II toxin-antitoxin system RelE/ParE family toxin [Alphaproteobacteria bacterium]
MRRIDLSRQAARVVEKLPPKHRRQVIGKITELARDPNPPDARALKGFSLMRADVGEYRIVYDVVDETVRVQVVGKRNDDEVYRILDRKR